MHKLSAMLKSGPLDAENLMEYAERLTQLSGGAIPLPNLEIRVKDKAIKHLEPNQKAVYTFSYKNRPLKIGIAGAKSHARLSSQHYLPNSCKSNLAKKILKLHSLVQFEELTNIQNIGNWIKENCERIDLIYTNIDNWTLRLIESAMHYKYKPLFEGTEKNIIEVINNQISVY